MGDHVRAEIGPTVAEPALLSRLEEALASLGAALGANDATNIERQLRTALDLGATRPQLEQAIETAHGPGERGTHPPARGRASPRRTRGAGCARGRSRTRRRRLRGGRREQARGARAEAADRPPMAAPLGDDATATNRNKGPAAACSDWMAELFATAGSGEPTGIAAAMANCHRMFEECVPPAGRARRDQRTADRD